MTPAKLKNSTLFIILFAYTILSCGSAFANSYASDKPVFVGVVVAASTYEPKVYDGLKEAHLDLRGAIDCAGPMMNRAIEEVGELMGRRTLLISLIDQKTNVGADQCSVLLKNNERIFARKLQNVSDDINIDGEIDKFLKLDNTDQFSEIGLPPTRKNIQAVLRAFSGKTIPPDSRAFIFFTGHGYVETDLARFLPSNATFDDALLMNDVWSSINKWLFSKSFIFLDQCQNFFDTAGKPSYLSSKQTRVRDEFAEWKNRTTSTFLATQPGSYAGIDNDAKMGYFTHALVKSLLLNDAKRLDDGVLSISDLNSLVHEEIKNLVGETVQQPHLVSNDTTASVVRTSRTSLRPIAVLKVVGPKQSERTLNNSAAAEPTTITERSPLLGTTEELIRNFENIINDGMEKRRWTGLSNLDRIVPLERVITDSYTRTEIADLVRKLARGFPQTKQENTNSIEALINTLTSRPISKFLGNNFPAYALFIVIEPSGEYKHVDYGVTMVALDRINKKLIKTSSNRKLKLSSKSVYRHAAMKKIVRGLLDNLENTFPKFLLRTVDVSCFEIKGFQPEKIDAIMSGGKNNEFDKIDDVEWEYFDIFNEFPQYFGSRLKEMLFPHEVKLLGDVLKSPDTDTEFVVAKYCYEALTRKANIGSNNSKRNIRSINIRGTIDHAPEHKTFFVTPFVDDCEWSRITGRKGASLNVTALDNNINAFLRRHRLSILTAKEIANNHELIFSSESKTGKEQRVTDPCWMY